VYFLSITLHGIYQLVQSTYLLLKVLLRTQPDVHPLSTAASHRHKGIAGNPPGYAAALPAHRKEGELTTDMKTAVSLV
jgi:hypothetical protein